MMLVEDTGYLVSSNLDSLRTRTLTRRTEDNTGGFAVRAFRDVVYHVIQPGFPATVGIAYATLTDIKGGIFTAIGIKTDEEAYVDPRVIWILLVGDLSTRLTRLVISAHLELTLVQPTIVAEVVHHLTITARSRNDSK